MHSIIWGWLGYGWCGGRCGERQGRHGRGRGIERSEWWGIRLCVRGRGIGRQRQRWRGWEEEIWSINKRGQTTPDPVNTARNGR